MKIYNDHFYCFSCQCGGDVIRLVSQLFSLSPLEAAKKLQADFGIQDVEFDKEQYKRECNTRMKQLLNTLSPEKQREYFQTSMEYLEILFGKKNTIYAIVHNDENTPHMHLGFVPMTEDNRVCAKEVINRNILRQIQEELPKYLQKAGFDIERGEVNSEAVHRTVKQYKADMEKEKAELAIAIQGQKQELQAIAEKKTDIRSVEEIATGKTLLGGKVTVEESDYQKLTDLAKKQIAVESKEKKLKKENASLRKENQQLKASNAVLNSQLISEQSMIQRLTLKKLEAEVRELRKFKQLAEKFLAEHGLKDYFRKAFIHSNNQDL